MKSSQSMLEKRQARKRFLLLLVAALMVILIWSGVSYLHTDSFCTTCHSMVAFKQSMARDKAHLEVPCIDCHLPADGANRQLALAGLIIDDLQANLKDEENKVFNAYVPDANCMRIDCHSGDTMDQDVKSRRNVVFREFRHTPHFERSIPQDVKLLCTTCHSSHGKYRERPKSPHFTVYLDNCFVCHAKKTTEPEPVGKALANQRCIHCHPRDQLSALQVGHALADGADPGKARILLDEVACAACHLLYARELQPVDAGSCRRCHPDLDESDWDPALNLHQAHIAGKQCDCIDCHKPHSHVKRQGKLVVESDCIGCHEDCMTLFKNQLALYQGVFEGLSLPIPDPMARSGISCASCHIREGYACSDGKDSCVHCHVAGYEKLVDLWQRTIKEKIETVQDLYDQAIKEGRFTELPAPIKRYMEYITRDGSLGVHNIVLTQYILLVCATPVVAPAPNKPPAPQPREGQDADDAPAPDPREGQDADDASAPDPKEDQDPDSVQNPDQGAGRVEEDDAGQDPHPPSDPDAAQKTENQGEKRSGPESEQGAR